jgi:hypothetical protein
MTDLSIEDIATQVIQAPTNIVLLQQLETALMQQQKQLLQTSSLSLFLPGNLPAAHALAHALSLALQQIKQQQLSSIIQLTAARIITNLAAAEVNHLSSGQDEDGLAYYGTATILTMSWSLLLTKTPGLIRPALQDAMIQPHSVELASQSCWCLGNLAADASCRDACSSLIPTLVQVLQASLLIHQVSLCRNAAWALSNLARGESARPFLGESLLTPSFVSQVLLSPERLKTSQDDSTVTWTHVAFEMLWILAFLTAREDDAVEYLCGQTPDSVSFSSQSPRLICEALACRLATKVDVIPCLRAVGNIATACGGRYISGLLEAHSGSVVNSLSLLLSDHATSSDAHIVAMEAAWAAGTLLCDAGMPNHGSTHYAVPVLLPTLCRTVTSEGSQLSLKRECLAALWNACAASPGESMGSSWSSRSVRDDFLWQIYQAPWMLRSLIDLLDTSVDMDLTMVAVELTNSLLRRLKERTTIVQEFIELQGVDTLEGICDRASQSHQYGSGDTWHGCTSEAADIAAGLIDDFLSEQGDNDDELPSVAPMALGNQFVFGAPESVSTWELGPTGFVATTSGSGLGRGRGRGISSKPAWMVKQDQQNEQM